MPPRLRSIVTTGWRAQLRGAVRLALVGCLALAIVGIVVETDRPCALGYHPGEPHQWGPARHILGDLAPMRLGFLVLALLAQALAHRGRLVIAIVLGPLAALAAMAVLMAIVSIHGRGHTLQAWFIAEPALLAAAAIGLAQPLIELWLALSERARSADAAEA